MLKPGPRVIKSQEPWLKRWLVASSAQTRILFCPRCKSVWVLSQPVSRYSIPAHSLIQNHSNWLRIPLWPQARLIPGKRHISVSLSVSADLLWDCEGRCWCVKPGVATSQDLKQNLWIFNFQSNAKLGRKITSIQQKRFWSSVFRPWKEIRSNNNKMCSCTLSWDSVYSCVLSISLFIVNYVLLTFY